MDNDSNSNGIIPVNVESRFESLTDIWSVLNSYKSLIERNRINDYLSLDLTGIDITDLPVLDHFRLLKISGIRYRKRESLPKALNAFYRILHASRTPFIYFLSVLENQTDLCVGLYVNDDNDIKKLIPLFNSLKSTIHGIFPGCIFDPMRNGNEKGNYIKRIMNLPERHIIKGVPSSSQAKDEKNSSVNESVAGIERLLDAMGDQEFAVVVVATPLPDEELAEFQTSIEQLHDQVNLLKKASLQHSSSHQKSSSLSNSVSDGTQESTTRGTQSSSARARHNGHVARRMGKNIKAWYGGGDKAQTQETTGSSEQQQWGNSRQTTFGETASESITKTGSITVERTNKTADYLVRQLDDMYQRIQDSRGIGMWRVGTTILSRDLETSIKAARIYAGMISGEKSHIDPVRPYRVENSVNPFSVAHDSYEQNHLLGPAYSGLYTYMTSPELAVAAGIPFYEVPSLPVEEMPDYGRSQSKTSSKVQSRKVKLGHLVDRSVETSIPVSVTTEQLNRHCFVTGATGSGKSNTMRQLLLQAWKEHQIPFLVIEPVKSEYRQLASQIDELKVFTLGHNTGSTLALNPFDFEQDVGLVSHIDHLKAAFNASLGMYSSMPFILEDIIYRVYEGFGWDLGSGTNEMLEQSAVRLGVPVNGPIRDLFLPRLSDLVPLVQEAIQGFFPSMTDYGGSLLGALRARLTSLTKGTKGQLLDSRSSVSMDWLLKRPCVLEIWPFADNEEKAFVMALILVKLYEYRERQHLTGKRPDGLEHLLVIEEAHRLLSKPQGNAEQGSNSRAKGVEVFADILAEIRSYGQGIIIVDQIPSKLIPDVLKNTDVKIAHRLVAKDDRDLVGATMTLEELHVRDLARHEPGLATIYFEGLHAPLQVKVAEFKLYEEESHIENVNLRLIRQLECFGGMRPDTLATFDSVDQRILAYQLIHGVLTTALSIGLDGVKRLRENLNQHLSIEPVGGEWAFIVSGLHTLHKALLQFELAPGERLIPPAQAGYLVSISASFLHKWINDNDITEDLVILRAESIGLGIITLNSEEHIPVDFLTALVGLYVNGTSGSFHNEITNALKMDRRSTELDWSNLQTTLVKHSDTMVMSLTYGMDIFCELASRLLTQYQTNDQEMKALAGLALGTLLKTTAEDKAMNIEG
jgi:hypothetical protein